MNKSMRIILLLALLAGIAVLARNQVAWATPSAEASLSAYQDDVQADVLPKKGDDPCILPNGKLRHRCKGTVKPPPQNVIIPVTGQYSIGGFCTLDVELSDADIPLNAVILAPLPRDLPDGVHKVGQGCLLTYSYISTNTRINTLSSTSGNATICFSAIAGKQMTLYYYDNDALSPAWVKLTTTNQNGIACAVGNSSGIYVATFQEP